MHFIGIDIGTTSICGVIYDFLNRETESIHIENESGIDVARSWEKIQDPQWIVTCVIQIIKKFESKYQDIKGIGITGQMHGIVYVDNEGEAVSPLYTWQDNRGNLILNSDISYAGFLTDHSGYNLSTGYGLVTHFYNIKNSILPKDAVKLCTIMDYVVMKLTGRKAPLTDHTNAAGLGFFNVRESKFDIASLNAVGIDASILPEVGESAVLAGYYNPDVPVYSAIGDNQAGFIGSVRDKERSMHVTIGTSSQLSVYSRDFFQVNALDTRPFPGGGYMLVGAVLSGGHSLAVLRSFFDTVISLSSRHVSEVADFYEVINAIDYKKDDPDALTVTTLFNGSRSNPLGRGSISNISTTNFTATNLILGFMRGICNEIYDFYSVIPYELKKDKDILVGSGNAIKKNDLLCRLLEETFNFEVVKSAHDEDAAFGACIAAAAGGKYASDFDTALKNNR
ncbi:MAG: FGGY family carbohydrate kinase [Chitinophagaceae bacterium]|nr:FGGY family carbohydrate kinase [Chitinophagaceae bacterium]